MFSPLQRRFLLPTLVLIGISILLTFHYMPPHPYRRRPDPPGSPLFPPPPTVAPSPLPKPAHGKVGTHLHLPATPPTSPSTAQPGCTYPILIHVTPDAHCTGALALYASIVRAVQLDPERLANKTCVHFTYVDRNLTLEAMYGWPARANPYTAVADCAALGGVVAKELNSVVPVRWQALAPIEKPEFMQTRPHWLAALNKIHSWAFDAYPRVLILDADSMVTADLAGIFDEADPKLTVLGGVDQFPSCNDRSRINGGMILLRPSRYFQVIAVELLHDPAASCLTGTWAQSEQELLNCICGYNYAWSPVAHPLRSEFSCGIMPVYNSVWPRNYNCSDVNVQAMRSIHFTACPKPWNVEEELLDLRFDTGYWKCLRDAGRAGGGMEKCRVPPSEVTRMVGMGGHFTVPT